MRGQGQGAAPSGNIRCVRQSRESASATSIGMGSPEGAAGRQQPEGLRRARAADSPQRRILQGAVTTTAPGGLGCGAHGW